MLDLGRFPTPDEFDRFHDLKSKVGTPRTVTRIFTTRFGDSTLESARQLRRDDLLAYLALANFHKKIPLKYLSDKLQADIRSFFGTYESALASARELLYSAGDSRNIEAACEGFPHGHQDEDALQIHRSLLKDLPAILVSRFALLVETSVACEAFFKTVPNQLPFPVSGGRGTAPLLGM
ncbi:MAG: hypothetical protein RLZZ179_3042 [Verrucomicrobiota bacterium]|jgi:DNA phosphorothioation-associated putative methyltransferase